VAKQKAAPGKRGTKETDRAKSPRTTRPVQKQSAEGRKVDSKSVGSSATRKKTSAGSARPAPAKKSQDKKAAPKTVAKASKPATKAKPAVSSKAAQPKAAAQKAGPKTAIAKTAGSKPAKPMTKPRAAKADKPNADKSVKRPAAAAKPLPASQASAPQPVSVKQSRPLRQGTSTADKARMLSRPPLGVRSAGVLQAARSVASRATKVVEVEKGRKSHLTAEELAEFRQVLLDKRRELVDDIVNLEDEARRSGGGSSSSAMPIHMADLGSDTWEQEFTLNLIEKERTIVREIDEALDRIEKKTYGTCLATGKAISKARLRVKPWAQYCIEYARKRELGLV
jgi:DnaK suppressor protein